MIEVKIDIKNSNLYNLKDATIAIFTYSALKRKKIDVQKDLPGKDIEENWKRSTY